MDDQFDNDLKNRIREVFDNFEDPTADDGWLQLRKKYPEAQASRRAFAWIWWGAAAILLLFLSTGLWMYIKNNHAEKFTIKIPRHISSENLTSTKNPSITNNKTTRVHTPNQADNIPGVTGKIAATHSNRLKTSKKLKNNPPVNTVARLFLNDTKGKKTYLATTADSGEMAVVKPFAQKPAVIAPANNSPAKPVIVKPMTSKSINDLFTNDHTATAKKSGENTEKVRFGVFAASYYNYAKGSSNIANLGAGFTAEIKIGKNLTLVSGITIAQNSLNFATGIPTTAGQSSFAVLAPPARASGAAAASAANVAASYAINNPVTVASAPVFRNYGANLVGLDVPLNLKYHFSPRKYDVYILAGLSSGTFMNETYTYQYNYPAIFSPSLQQMQDETSHKSFNGFYFAKIVNLAFGVGYPLGKNSITLEPFLRYPLDGLGSQNIRFGAGGINLKFNFESQKK